MISCDCHMTDWSPAPVVYASSPGNVHGASSTPEEFCVVFDVAQRENGLPGGSNALNHRLFSLRQNQFFMFLRLAVRVGSDHVTV